MASESKSNAPSTLASDFASISIDTIETESQNMMRTLYAMITRRIHVGRHVQQRNGPDLQSLLLGTGATGKRYQRVSKGVRSASHVSKTTFLHIILRLRTKLL